MHCAVYSCPLYLPGSDHRHRFPPLTLSPLAAISEFGILAVIGIIMAILVTLVYTPAILHCAYIDTKEASTGRTPCKAQPF